MKSSGARGSFVELQPRNSPFGIERILVAGKEPGQEVDCGDRHANAEKNSREHALRAAFTERKREAGDDDGHKRESAGDGAGESGLKDGYRIFPRRRTLLSESRKSQKQRGANKRYGKTGVPRRARR